MVEFVFQFDDSIIDDSKKNDSKNETTSIDEVVDERAMIAEAINDKTDEVKH